MFFIYTLLYITALVIILPFEFFKRPKGQRLNWLIQKGGTAPLINRHAASSPTILIHAVSVGEVLASISFIKALKEMRPELSILVSTITDTGQKVARERLSGIADVIYLPFDLPFAIKNLMQRCNVKVFITMETELWPNLFRTFNASGVPIVILNGRISEKSFGGYAKIKFFLKDVLNAVSLFCMQDEVYARRIIELGAKEEKVKVTGSFKFDISLPAARPAWAEGIGKPVIVAGSTHRGEEELILDVFLRLKKYFSPLTLIVAPRHPERFDEVEGFIRDRGVDYQRRSRLVGDALPPVVLLDSIGELSSVYSIADIAVVGGSFIEHGGQNPLEPAYWGKPVVCGPSMRNFPFIKEFYDKGAAVGATSDTLFDVLHELLSFEDRRIETGRRAKELLNRNQGAVDRAMRALETYL